MKVLQINSVCGIRSTGRICTDIAERLEAEGHICKIAYGRESVPEQYLKFAVRIGSGFSVKLDALKTRLFDNAGFNSKRQTKKFIEWVKEYDPDIIHLHNVHGYYINVEVLFEYIRNSNKTVVWTFHDCWPFTGHCSYFDSVDCEKWKDGCQKCALKKAYPKSAFFDNSKKSYEKKKKVFSEIPNLFIVTPSQWLAEFAKQSFFRGKDIRVINNGIDIEVFKHTDSDFRQKFGLIDKKIILGVANPWGKRKGLYDFIELSKRIKDNYKIVLVGLSEEQKKVLPTNIVAISRTNDTKELAEIYTAADVFVNPTYADNYPTVNLEAQACGTPVITYRTGGSPESIPNRQVVEKGDLEELEKKIYNLCEEADYEVIKKEAFDKKTLFQKYLELYNEYARN